MALSRAATNSVSDSFTAYGNGREASTWSGSPTSGELSNMNGITREAYTFQTVLGSMGLNHMNGRIEDSCVAFCTTSARKPHQAKHATPKSLGLLIKLGQRQTVVKMRQRLSVLLGNMCFGASPAQCFQFAMRRALPKKSRAAQVWIRSTQVNGP